MFARGLARLEGELELLMKFSADMEMTLGMEQCSVIFVKRGRIVDQSDLKLRDGTEMRSLSNEETYKYLGLQQTFEIKKKKTNNKLKVGYSEEQNCDSNYKSQLKTKYMPFGLYRRSLTH